MKDKPIKSNSPNDNNYITKNRCLSNLDELIALVRNNQFIIYDTEFTAWEGSMERNWLLPWEHRELIQIGAVKVEMNPSPRIIDELNIILYPKINCKLSKYISQLTGITQERVDSEGVDFKDAISNLFRFSNNGEAPLMSYGDDFQIILENARLYGDQLPNFKAGSYDITSIFQSMGINTSLYSSGTLYQNLDIQFSGRAHDAVADATSVAITLEMLIKKRYFSDCEQHEKKAA